MSQNMQEVVQKEFELHCLFRKDLPENPFAKFTGNNEYNGKYINEHMSGMFEGFKMGIACIRGQEARLHPERNIGPGLITKFIEECEKAGMPVTVGIGDREELGKIIKAALDAASFFPA
ncbi:hypothetical protein [Ralstonia phage RP13]|nr:hypothetical protein [Ralstonia phage RP13]